MPAYVVVDIKVTDPDIYSQYRELAPAIVKAFGGEYVVRGGKTEILEGSPSPNRIVVLKFESLAKVREWLDSPEYRDARKLRHKSTITKMYMVEGVDDNQVN